MLVTISPAKSLDLTPVGLTPTEPRFASDALRLAKTMRGQTLTQLRGLMAISDDLARLNRDRFRDFSAAPQTDAVKPAAWMFDGDTYTGLDAKTLGPEDIAFAQERLCILSGLYGVLRPLDAIQPYRLEMGSRLKTRRGASLYDYWGDTIARTLNAQAQALGSNTLVNCASQEYFAAASRPALKLRVITPQFLEVKDGRPRVVSFFAKRARGAMARFIVTQQVTDSLGIREFSAGGYRYDAGLSESDTWAFVRDYPG